MRRDGLQPWLLLAPALSVVLALFGGAVALTVVQSLGWLPALGSTTLSLDAYRAVLGRAEFWAALALTVWVAAAATGLSAVLAVAAALLLRPAFRGRRWAAFLFQLNLPIPHSVGAIGLLWLLAQSGLLARAAHSLGLITAPDQFPVLVNDPLGLGIILEYAWKGAVFSGVAVLAALQTQGEAHESAARTLGASAWQRFGFVTWPLIRPTLTASSLLVFAFAFGAFEVPLVLGQRYPSMLPVLAYRAYIDTDLEVRPEAMALSVLLTAFSAGLVAAYWRLTRER